MTQFKVGDKVRLKAGIRGPYHTAGKTYRITQSGDERTARSTDDDGDEFLNLQGRFELVAPPKVLGVFAVGDRVRVIGKTSYGHGFDVGHEGDVLCLIDAERLEVSGPNFNQRLHPRDLEHADTPATPEPDARIALADKALAWLKAELADEDTDEETSIAYERMLRDVFGLRYRKTPAVPAKHDFPALNDF